MDCVRTAILLSGALFMTVGFLIGGESGAVAQEMGEGGFERDGFGQQGFGLRPSVPSYPAHPGGPWGETGSRGPWG
jgi:hypothetical protein